MASRSDLAQAAAWLAEANGLLITAGAGIGIDSGLPDFRGPGGFWAAYPALGRARIAFESIANPEAFRSEPRLAWGFYGHRLELYRRTIPHAGFTLLQAMGKQMAHGSWVFTSNVDGQFQKAGFSEQHICEIHGSIHHLQCSAGCTERIWSAADFQPNIDSEHGRLLGELPSCPHCGQLARPNILLFDDWGWVERRTTLQYQRLKQWMATVDRLVCLEIGAGRQIPTVRRFSENAGGRLIRINPAEPEIDASNQQLALPLDALDGISRLYKACRRR
ncbi:NAD-dependent deacetylase [Dechloromonas denitrificans]|uniref:protein acetyllysine N-acetyltransferase n=1 Tax=Dechloromonas denitrificans TaxID=281362 RepID=A0A133XET3_9RHOO|nr:Sir2 family NAD-dependent protein deacetylase [Dechloromonas denitrificans]KXB29434.1 NAD-dependent deacetylase [Dechloromonas denitrificans]